VLEAGDLKVAQSLAIVRFLARRGGLEGKSDADYAVSEMLIQEFEDVYGVLAKANYVPDDAKVAAWTKARDETLPHHLANLEKLLPAGSAFFTTEGPTAGDLAAYMALNFALDVNADALDKFPKLAGFYKHVETLPGVQEYHAKDSVPTYFKVGLFDWVGCGFDSPPFPRSPPFKPAFVL
jgi:glutathione S-transferase